MKIEKNFKQIANKKFKFIFSKQLFKQFSIMHESIVELKYIV